MLNYFLENLCGLFLILSHIEEKPDQKVYKPTGFVLFSFPADNTSFNI
jgi:hypothetical protein